jgi:hypothetical protein
VRVMAALWLVLGIAIWNGFFDLYVSRAAREYLKLLADHQLGRGPDPDMAGIQANAIRSGIWASSLWAGLVVAAGWGTMWAMARSRKARSPKFEVRS